MMDKVFDHFPLGLLIKVRAQVAALSTDAAGKVTTMIPTGKENSMPFSADKASCIALFDAAIARKQAHTGAST
jgi:hypothetical protein